MQKQSDSDGVDRQRPSGWLASVSALLITTLTATLGYYLWSEFPDLGAERSVTSNLGFFLLINLNIIVVMILVFLVSKNIITLVLDRRRNMLGSRLRSRLVGAFVALSLVPTVLLFLVAKGILESVLQGWFSPQVAASVDGALNIAKYHTDSANSQLTREARHLGNQLSVLFPSMSGPAVSGLAAGKPGSVSSEAVNALQSYLQRKREEYELLSLAVLDTNGNEIVRSDSIKEEQHHIEVPGPNLRSVSRSALGVVVTHPEHSLTNEFLRAYAPVQIAIYPSDSATLARLRAEDRSSRAKYVVVATHWVTPQLGTMLSSVINNYEDYNELRTYRRPLASSYLLTLIVVTLLIVFTAIWVGFYLAKSLAVPIGLLGKATSQVAHGNLDYQIPEVGDDELSLLVRSFNTMTADLKATTGELVARRRYMEAVFANVAVGIISVDPVLRIQAINIAANEILGLQTGREIVGTMLDTAVPGEFYKQVETMTGDLFNNSPRTLEGNVAVTVHDQPKQLLLTLTKLLDDRGRTLGAVLLFDDITELVSAQRMAAWREVARRIAHEIKNPLTPIQLCAQRLQRRFRDDSVKDAGESDRTVVLESTDVIVKQVENLRSLVNEFSRFARMPRSNPHPNDLNQLLAETTAMFRDMHPEVQFDFRPDPTLPIFELDREQLGRALINLLDNAIAAVGENGRANGPAENRIGLSTNYDLELGMVSVVISDNGVGISDLDKPKLFEPYFSTKRGGTGLGLAIVSTIVTDHSGFIRVRDNQPRGATFTIELPVTESSKLKLAAN